MEGTVTISKKEYLRLIMDSEILTRLENGGVDNWEYYEDSINDVNDIDIDDFEEQEKERIKLL